MPTWNPIMTKDFWSDFARLPSDVTQRTKRAVDRMLQDPWAPELHPEKVQSAEAGVYSCRADDSYRIIWKHIKPNDIVFLLVDKHDEAYRRAARKTFTLKDDIVQVADIVEVGAKPSEALQGFTPSNRSGEKIGKLFVGYTDKEILDWGVPPELLPNVRTLDDVDELAQFENSAILPSAVFDKMLSVALGIVERPVIPDDKLRESLTRHQGGEDIYRFIDTDEFKRVLEGSMEEWMLFLAPFQRALAQREFNGPARIRGVAGSGKTVVALHRARYLARKVLGTGKKVLFLTFGNRLPGVITYLLEKLVGPNAPELDSFECLSIHQLCSRLMREAQIFPEVKDEVCQEALAYAIAKVKERFNPPNLFSRSSQFFQDEIRYTIKGHAIKTLDEYLKLDRTGRGSALQDSERQAVFAVYEEYQRQLRMADKCDFDDFILETILLLEKGEVECNYAHLVVDEIQDLTEATMRLIRLLVPPGANDLFLVGDGMQRIYPGGYSLNKFGIDVIGRSTLLRKNYRNTQQILQAAHALVRDANFDDMNDQESQVPEPEYSVRQGKLPILKGFSSPEGEIQWIAQEINRLQTDGYGLGDIALLYRYTFPYKDLFETNSFGKTSTLEITRDPQSYFGRQVKHTTFHSAKGLEFKVIFVIGVTDGQFVPKDDWSLEGEELADYLERERRLLYVAMTRARDLLYLTYSRGQPSRFLSSIPKGFWRQK